MATSGATLDSIYNRLSSAPEYHPFSADTFSDWSMEAGDIIRVSRDGKHYDSPVHTSQMTWRGQSQISVSSDGNEKRESIAKATKRKYGRGGSGYRNDNHLRQELLDDYNGLYSFFEVTSSRMFVTFSGMYDGLSSDFEVTRSRMAADFQGKYDGLASSFEVTRSRMAADFQGMYDGLSSEFEVTRSRMRVEFRGMYDGLSSDFEVTRSRMAADFQGKYDGLASSFEVTRSRMAADFQGKYDGLSSEFEVTRSQFHVELVNSYNQLSSGIEAAANYAMLYTNGKTSRAYIMTQINDNTEQTEALINADQILIGTSGNAKINLANVITLGDSSTVLIKKNVTVNETYGANGVKLMTDGTIRGHQLTLIKTGGQEGEYAVKSITSDDIDDMVVKAAIDGNTLRLWKRGANLEATSGDGIINFSKAVTLSGAWDNGNFPLTINATQTNGGTITNVGSKSIGFTNASDFYLTIEKNGDPSAFGSSRKLINVPYKIVHHGGTGVGDQDRFIGSLAAIDATSVYNNGWDDVALNDPDWQYPAANHNSDNTTASNSVVVKASDKSDGSVRQKTIPIALTVDTTNKKAKVTAGGYVRAIANIDMKTNAEYNTEVANAGYAGRAAVTISDTIKWGTEPSSGINVSSNSIKVSTAGRTTSDGTIQQSEKTINLYTQSSVSYPNVTFYVTHTDSTDGNRILKKEVTCSAPYSVTDGSVVPINFTNPPSGWTKHEFTVSGTKYQYHTKNGTSGSGTNVLVYFIPRLTVDGSVLNPGTTIYRSNSTIPTQIWNDAYTAGVASVGNIGTINDLSFTNSNAGVDDGNIYKPITVTGTACEPYTFKINLREVSTYVAGEGQVPTVQLITYQEDKASAQQFRYAYSLHLKNVPKDISGSLYEYTFGNETKHYNHTSGEGTSANCQGSMTVKLLNSSNEAVVTKSIAINTAVTEAYRDGYSSGYTAGGSGQQSGTSVNEVNKVILDSYIDTSVTPPATKYNRSGSWWNFKLYKGSTILKSQSTDGSTVGLYMPTHQLSVTSNGTYYPWQYNAAVFDSVVVSVPTGSSGPSHSDSFNVTVSQDSAGNHVMITKTYPLSSSCPFVTTTSKTFYWK